MALNNANGQIEVLTRWNDTLRAENQELRNIIYRKFGLMPEQQQLSQQTPQQTPQTPPSWRQVKHTLEEAHKANRPAILQEQQDYWEAKLRTQENSDAKVSGEKAEETVRQ
jgi:hypothetical protein